MNDPSSSSADAVLLRSPFERLPRALGINFAVALRTVAALSGQESWITLTVWLTVMTSSLALRLKAWSDFQRLNDQPFLISRWRVTRRLLQGLDAPVYGQRPPKPRLIEPFEGYLRDRVTAWPNLSAKRLFREIKERGYIGGYSAITAYLRVVRPPSVQLYERRCETQAGEQAQVDSPISRSPALSIFLADARGVVQG